MTFNCAEISLEHGRDMRRIALEHAIIMAELYRDNSNNPINDLIANLKQTIETEKHDRFNENHRKVCDDCRSGYEDFIQDQADDERIDHEN